MGACVLAMQFLELGMIAYFRIGLCWYAAIADADAAAAACTADASPYGVAAAHAAALEGHICGLQSPLPSDVKHSSIQLIW